MIETSGDVLRLLQPVSGTCLRVNDINQKVLVGSYNEMEDLQKPEDKCGFDGEFQSLKLIEDVHIFTTNAATKTENLNKNRYKNILPYDMTRVVLRQDNEESNFSDYINANYIRPSRLYNSSSSVQSSNDSINSVHSLTMHNDSRNVPALVTKSLSDDALREVRKCIKLDKINGNLHRSTVKDKVYIATQGCLSNTVNDFWRMIWQEDIRVIVMITNEVEQGKRKCERYWPQPSQEGRYENLIIKLISETCYEDYLLREFDVSDKTTCRTIYHYQFTAWPDHSTPPEPDGVLAFLDDINRRMFQNTQCTDAPEQNLLCVHCSAGVGRTGTFIVLDMLIDKIKTLGINCDIDIHNTVKMVRTQRRGMVQNKAQYKFIYLAIQSYVDNKSMHLRKKMLTPALDA